MHFERGTYENYWKLPVVSAFFMSRWRARKAREKAEGLTGLRAQSHQSPSSDVPSISWEKVNPISHLPGEGLTLDFNRRCWARHPKRHTYSVASLPFFWDWGLPDPNFMLARMPDRLPENVSAKMSDIIPEYMSDRNDRQACQIEWIECR